MHAGSSQSELLREPFLHVDWAHSWHVATRATSARGCSHLAAAPPIFHCHFPGQIRGVCRTAIAAHRVRSHPDCIRIKQDGRIRSLRQAVLGNTVEEVSSISPGELMARMLSANVWCARPDRHRSYD